MGWEVPRYAYHTSRSKIEHRLRTIQGKDALCGYTSASSCQLARPPSVLGIGDLLGGDFEEDANERINVQDAAWVYPHWFLGLVDVHAAEQPLVVRGVASLDYGSLPVNVHAGKGIHPNG